MKTFSFLVMFALAGLFFVSFTGDAKAGFSSNGGCINFCADECEAAFEKDCVDDCFGQSGRDRGQCIKDCNICTDCCYYECLDVICDLPRKNTNDRELCADEFDSQECRLPRR